MHIYRYSRTSLRPLRRCWNPRSLWRVLHAQFDPLPNLVCQLLLPCLPLTRSIKQASSLPCALRTGFDRTRQQDRQRVHRPRPQAKIPGCRGSLPYSVSYSFFTLVLALTASRRYWDWATNPVLPDIIAVQQTVNVIAPTGQKSIANPLYQYRFHPVRSDFADGLPDERTVSNGCLDRKPFC